MPESNNFNVFWMPDPVRHDNPVAFTSPLSSHFSSYPQLLKVLFNNRRQFHGLGVEIVQFHMNFTQRLLEIEIFVFLLGRDAHI